MSEESFVYNLYKFISVTVVTTYMVIANVDMTRVIVIALVLFCLFTLQLFMDFKINEWKEHHRQKSSWYSRCNNILSIICFFVLLGTNDGMLTPIIAVFIIALTGSIQEVWMNYSIRILALLLYFYITESPAIMILLSVFLVIGMYYHRKTSSKLEEAQNRNLKQRAEIILLEEKMKDNQRLMKTIRYAAALEERNRMSARLHDKIGHNISGTILMLEASLLQMEKDPNKAMTEVLRAVSHLRKGVDDLRHALREERPIKSDVNVNDIQLLLDEARTDYGLHTLLKTEGDLEQISIQQWDCMKENATELLTNVLKHSKATMYQIHIKVMPSMILVTYSDNGSCSPVFQKGLGLEAVEDRTTRCKGRCFFEAGELGFKVTNIFLENIG